MTLEAHVSHDGATLTVNLPLQFSRRGGWKQVVMAEGQSAPASVNARMDSTLVKALARAHRWQRMLESGNYGSITELAAAQGINASYLARILRLTPCSRRSWWKQFSTEKPRKSRLVAS
jgi:hypothetical protein